MEPANVGLWPSVDVALRDDGSRGVAGLARGWVERVRAGAGIVSAAMAAECAVDAAVFGMHRPGLAFAEILMLWLVLAATLVSFWRVRKLAGVLLTLYLAWVSLATALNFTIWRLNP